MKAIEIKRISINDINQLQKVARQTFSETFAEVNTEGNMRKYLDESFATSKLLAELNNSNSQFYLATMDGRAIGYLKLNFGEAQTELQDDRAVEIERIYVIREFHGQKVGQLLYDKAIQISQERKGHYVWLGVWENNKRAIRFYQKNGFTEFDKHIFQLGDDVQTDLLMKRVLAEGEGGK